LAAAIAACVVLLDLIGAPLAFPCHSRPAEPRADTNSSWNALELVAA
jgi:hypothetical protein